MGTGNRQEAIGNRQEAIGKRQEAKGKRQKAKGKRQEARGKRQKLCDEAKLPPKAISPKGYATRSLIPQLNSNWRSPLTPQNSGGNTYHLYHTPRFPIPDSRFPIPVCHSVETCSRQLLPTPSKKICYKNFQNML
ncbi:CsbD family protein [Moorena sp. SIO3H5]|uniref:CsbD family protein n=1 Tax=Moorena sp. SIO3H5 TaxID=2607834 RepID=UPI0025F50233|nr:CsbD family protein [Moorena sp. SIO3H5]